MNSKDCSLKNKCESKLEKNCNIKSKCDSTPACKKEKEKKDCCPEECC